MHAFTLQDWTTIQGGVATVTQGEESWLDLTPYQDVVFWLDVRQATGSPSVTYQTSPTKDESLFQGMVGAASMAAGTSPTVAKALLSGATVPIARYLRWQITGTAPWTATFRILIAANAPGM